MADANLHVPCHAQALLIARCAVALRSHFQNGVIMAWQGRGMDAAWHV
jgi:hypothetical protein